MKYLVKIIMLICLLNSCVQEQDNLFTENSSVRIEKKIETLQKKLIKPENGWLLSYFPNLEDNRYVNIKENLYTDDLSYIRLRSQEGFGYGGYSFLIQFNKENTFNIQSDFSLERGIITGEYDLVHKDAIQLSFLSRNPIHNLTAKGFNGKSSFIVKEIKEDKIILATATNINKNKEYIVLQKLATNVVWDDYFQKIKEIKNEFENMKTPVLNIKDNQGNTVFESNYYPRTSEDTPYFLNTYQRYMLFVEDIAPNTYNSKFLVGIGSGYTFTPNEIIFNSGFIYNKNIVFKNFQKINPKEFIAEVSGYTAYIKEK